MLTASEMGKRGAAITNAKLTKEQRSEAAKKGWRKRVSQKIKQKAHSEVMKAVKNGTLIKPLHCELCKEEKKLEGHHIDYYQPLNVMWLCKQCHCQWHKENGTTETIDVTTVTIRISNKSWRRLKIKAVEKGLTLMDYLDQLSKTK